MMCLCSSTSRLGGIRTLSDLNRPSSNGYNSDSDGPQEYYTGGEKSLPPLHQNFDLLSPFVLHTDSPHYW
ncbi:putative transaminase [Helianthus anomalus]